MSKKDFYKQMPSDGRTDEEIKQEAARLNGWNDQFTGVYSKDQLPSLKNNQSAVVNLQNSVDKKGKPLPGSHWVSTGIHNNKPWYDIFIYSDLQQIECVYLFLNVSFFRVDDIRHHIRIMLIRRGERVRN